MMILMMIVTSMTWMVRMIKTLLMTQKEKHHMEKGRKTWTVMEMMIKMMVVTKVLRKDRTILLCSQMCQMLI